MIDKTAKNIVRYKHGNANFTYIEKFDDAEKAANPSNEGELVEVKVNEIKWDFTKVKEENGREPNGGDQARPAKDEGPTKKEK
jgi:hypothetical protein|tara:strand:- start:453 stop:701 length:249 start_codon:yes stop_codon:yes gene_type:complete